jgi:hypothetical protein
MAYNRVLRQYIVLKATEYLCRVYAAANPKAWAEMTADLLEAIDVPALSRSLAVRSAPSFGWELRVVGEHPKAPTPDKLIISYEAADAASLRAFRDAVQKHVSVPLQDANGNVFTILAIGADPGGGTADHWCPGIADLSAFSHRTDVRRLMGADALAKSHLGGKGVNVVIIDEGLDQALIPAKNWGGGLINIPQASAPGTASRTSHGMMIARNVLDLAPDAVLYDVPLIPAHIANVDAFASKANSAYVALLLFIQFLRGFPRWSGPWVLVNAWAVFDRATETPLGSYTQNEQLPFGHPLNNVVGEAVNVLGLDVVFAAGNCGQFCPSRRCGGLDRGPGHSIWGANSHAAVMTAGGVLTDEMWLGYSSQGPGQIRLGTEKPDFCAPSNFCETYDAAERNTGTSASCALTAGIVAALRGNPKWDQAAVPPHVLKALLALTARKPQGPAWNRRLGNGILDASAALTKLSTAFP